MPFLLVFLPSQKPRHQNRDDGHGVRGGAAAAVPVELKLPEVELQDSSAGVS